MIRYLPKGVREWMLVLFGAVGGIGGTLFCAEHLHAHQIPDNVPGLVAAGVALIGIWIGAVNFERWESRHRKEKRAEVAAEAIMAAIDATELFRATIGAGNMCLHANDRANAQEVVQALRHKELSERLFRARSKVGAYMPKLCVDIFDRLFTRKKSMDLVLSAWAQGGELAKELLINMFGTAAEQSIEKDLKAVQEVFGEYVLPP